MKTYQTQSLYEASYLLTKDFQIISRDHQGQKAGLSFEDTSELRQAILDFYNGKGVSSAKSLFDSYRTLKDMIFQR